ncbi:MAG: FAD-dependent protein [Ginsengibacter sp.]
MQKEISLTLNPSEAADYTIVRQSIAAETGFEENEIFGYTIIKRSIDARARTISIHLVVNAFINEPFQKRPLQQFNYQDVSSAKTTIIIVGAGPAGIFAALKLVEMGIRPVILERGKDVRARRRDLAILNKQGIINTESNYCFGEGGAGTYSDGKLYTRSSKRGSVDRILNVFVHFGAGENILYDAHPHIGTNKLPAIITSMREQIIACGGEVLFEKKVTDFITDGNQIKGVKCDGDLTFTADAYIVATGHSARDIFTILHDKKILIEARPFALGVRVEHPQSLIDHIQYHISYADAEKNNISNFTSQFLPPATYGLVEQVDTRGVFSFCMCPGGIIAPASTNNQELVVNGWSPSKRNNFFANSGMVVQVHPADAILFFKNHKGGKSKTAESPLLMMNFQKIIEEKAYTAGGGNFVAPAQRMIDFVANKVSPSLPSCSYLPGIKSSDLQEVLPEFISGSLQRAFKSFGNKMKSYAGGYSFYTNEAVVVATESRTSSPVRIPRNEELHHPQIKNLYPCGEGAGYAGGIVSAAMDGEKIATQLASIFKK